MASQIWAHGEDKPGPNGGFISMPGAFHVELVPVNARQLKAYLLDIDWKNPTLKESSIELSQGALAAKCKAKTDHFVCDFPAAVDLTKPGELTVNSTREKQKGNTVKYSLPLKTEMKH
jgi:hypothetical protein